MYDDAMIIAMGEACSLTRQRRASWSSILWQSSHGRSIHTSAMPTNMLNYNASKVAIPYIQYLGLRVPVVEHHFKI